MSSHQTSASVNFSAKISGFLCSLCVGLFASFPAVNAAEQVSLRASGFERSLAVADLRKLADTGEQSDVLSGLLATARLDPNQVRGYLALSIDIKQFDVDITLVDKFLNSYFVELFLQDIGKSLRGPGGESGASAIKAAIINSLADDNKISAIEFIEKYPTEMVVEIEGLTRTQERVRKDYASLAGPFSKILQRLQQIRG